MRIVNIIGTRPQYIKLAGMYLEFNKRNHEIVNIDTGQHYDDNMSKNFIMDFNIPIHYKTINIWQIRNILDSFNPDVVLIYGDTFSTLIGWMASREYRTAHIEAGVRIHNREYIEEIIRMAVDCGCDICFAPGKRAFENLKSEGKIDNVYLVGDVTYDLLLNIGNIATRYINEEYIYVTLHRQRNVNDKSRLQDIINQLGIIKIPVVFPVHPRTKKMIKKYKITIPKNVIIIDPVSYLDSIRYINNAKCVITDSGGVEKEAYLLKTHGIILNTDTSWPETMETGWNKITKISDIKKNVDKIKHTSRWENCYGDGDAGKKILDILEEIVGKNTST